MMNGTIDLDAIDSAIGGRLGQHDIACPMCGPTRRAPANQRRRVLRIWRIEPGFATYHCARCGAGGHTRDELAPTPNRQELERARIEAEARERVAAERRLSKARWLWSLRRPIAGSLAETYLRHRQITGPLPATLGFLPARGKHGPIGSSAGWPIVLASAGDMLSLVITEGIEDGLTSHGLIGIGAWAAGSASRMPALAGMVPSYVESVIVLADSDPDGQRHARALATKMVGTVPEVRLASVPPMRVAA